MAIITCEKCGKKYSDKTPGGCPHCNSVTHSLTRKLSPFELALCILVPIVSLAFHIGYTEHKRSEEREIKRAAIEKKNQSARAGD